MAKRDSNIVTMPFGGVDESDQGHLVFGGLLAGVVVGLSGAVYLATSSHDLGSILFSMGLLLVVTLDYPLYTGRIGGIVESRNPWGYLLSCCIVLICNGLGAIVTGHLFGATSVGSTLTETSAGIIRKRIEFGPTQPLVSGILCNALIYFGVKGFSVWKDRRNLTGVLTLVLCVTAFVRCGFDHCVADLFYIGLGDVSTAEAGNFIGIVVVGNSVGALVAALADHGWKRVDF